MDKAIMHDYMHVFVFVHADTCVHTCVCVSLRVYLFAFALSCLISVCFNDAVATLANTCCLTYGHAHTRTHTHIETWLSSQVQIIFNIQ